MFLKKNLLIFYFLVFMVLFLPLCAYAYRGLNTRELERLKAVYLLLRDVDNESLQATIIQIEKSKHPDMDIFVKEAIAKAYRAIADEEHVQGHKKKAWLYSMVCLNMAYFQFSGGASSGNTTALNALIRQKLRLYLPPNIYKDPGFYYSLE